MSNYYTYICKACGSEDIRSDAWASWDKHTQEWELSTTFENYYCNNCEGECQIRRKLIEEVTL